MVYLLIYILVLSLPALIIAFLVRPWGVAGRKRARIGLFAYAAILLVGGIALWIQAATGLSLSNARPFGLPPALAGLLMASPAVFAALISMQIGLRIRTRV